MNESIIKVVIGFVGVIIPISVLLFNRFLKDYDERIERIEELIDRLDCSSEKQRIAVIENELKHIKEIVDRRRIK